MDFLVPITPLPELRTLVIMGHDTPISGIGVLQWIFLTGGTTVAIRNHCYYAPNARYFLPIPQRLFINCGGATSIFTIGDKCDTLSLDIKEYFQISYDSGSYLSISLAHNDTASASSTEANPSVISNENKNLTPSPKLLLLWHQKFGYRNMQSIQHMFCHVHLFTSTKFTVDSKFEIPKCETCEYAKAIRQTTNRFTPISKPDTNCALKASHNCPGYHISVDHFGYRLKVRTLTSFVQSSYEEYFGGYICMYHASRYLHAEHQLGLSVSETIIFKHKFEKLSTDRGVVID